MKVTKSNAKKIAEKYAESVLALKEAAATKKELETALTDYCESTEYTGPIGPLLSYTKTTSKLVGDKVDLATVQQKLGDAYTKSSLDQSKVIADAESSNVIQEMLEDFEITIENKTGYYLKGLV